MLISFLAGLGVAFGLNVAIGAQNAWVLSKSMKGEHPRVIAGVCTSLDALLITVGIFTIGSLQLLLPSLIPIMTWLGVLILSSLAAQAFWRAWQGSSGLLVHASADGVSPWQMAGQAMAISLLNPHVYLDTVILMGSIGAQQVFPLVFLLGAILASAFWFFSLASFAGYLGSKLQSVRAWRIFDALIGSIMLLVAISLLLQ